MFDIDGSGIVQAVFWGIGKTADVHGYVDLALLNRKNWDPVQCPDIEWLRAIIHPSNLSLIVRQHFETFLPGLFRPSANVIRSAKEDLDLRPMHSGFVPDLSEFDVPMPLISSLLPHGPFFFHPHQASGCQCMRFEACGDI